MIRVIFFGTPQIAADILQTIHQLPNVEIVGVVSQPDKQKNRKQDLLMTPVKAYCVAHNLKHLAPEKIATITDEIKQLIPDIIITCAYGQFIPQKIIDIPRYKIVNVHASLLPRLRGGAPIHYAIINGYKETGVTLMHTIKQMDAGNILFSKKTGITEKTTYASLLKTLTQLGQDLIQEHFNDLCSSDLIGQVQDEQLVTFGYNITKEQRYINFNQPAWMVNRFVNGLNDKPVALWSYNDIDIKVYNIELTNQKSVYPPGTIKLVNKQILIATSDFDIKIKTIQLPNKKITAIDAILNGNSIFDSLK
ncbi:methionyl-tRNA formyltransferase [Ureaplasma sp. ES3154-GEN]|uniref:methionyl-tRNA formyltransferase n=1 Tax=Ureaplasma sp. ES3154-GEN TaxID=2984844 RepID=UPI0021E95149|nr:methionyl-tRNA formyltransferase [Ureaplasma sp. ES3154-GEN]MCV3743347.1 methionyl-tRNA formyltransferase [Ureaplasma sp. ES3154-GEN]